MGAEAQYRLKKTKPESNENSKDVDVNVNRLAWCVCVCVCVFGGAAAWWWEDRPFDSLATTTCPCATYKIHVPVHLSKSNMSVRVALLEHHVTTPGTSSPDRFACRT